MIDLNVELKPEFKKKINHPAVKQAVANTIRNTTLQAERKCKSTAPYKTGQLRRSHSSNIGADEGQVRNSANYAVYVIYGTSRMAARNYPQKVCNELSSSKYASRELEKELRSKGVLG